MEGNDHNECPVEIRLCPDHQNEQDRPAPEPGFVTIDFSSVKPRAALPHCECGCAEIESGEGIGWCLHCDHVYTDYNSQLETRHFAEHCPGVPESAKHQARARLAKRGT